VHIFKIKIKGPDCHFEFGHSENISSNGTQVPAAGSCSWIKKKVLFSQLAAKRVQQRNWFTTEILKSTHVMLSTHGTEGKLLKPTILSSPISTLCTSE
jgi:hypothetical protein